MHITHRRATPNTVILKLLSITFGYIVWSIMSQSHITTLQQTIPIYFYNIPKQTHIIAPEQVTIQVRGKKKILHSLVKESLAAHVDAKKLKQGDNLISLSKSMLFLPDQIDILRITPGPILISLQPS